MTRLRDALRKRFQTPQEAIEALGLDSAILDEPKEVLAMDSVAMSPIAARAKRLLTSYLEPRLAADANVDLNPIVQDITAKNYSQKYLRQAVGWVTKNRLAKDVDLEDIQEVLEAIEEAKEGGEADQVMMTDPNSAVPVVAPPPDDDDADVLAELLAALAPDDPKYNSVDRMYRAADDKRYSDDESEEEMMERKKCEDRARKAHDALGRDETEEEMMEREKKESAEDARRFYGRDETEEECAEREAKDGRARDVRRAYDNWMHAKDARKAGSMDAKAADMMKRAHDALRAARAADRAGRGAADQPPPFKGMPVPGEGPMNKPAMDEANIDARIAAAIARRDKEHIDAREAENFVRPWIGTPSMALDSAEAIYGRAMTMLGKDPKGKSAEWMREVISMTPRPGNEQPHAPGPRNYAADAAPAGQSFTDFFPDAKRIVVMG